MDYCKTYQSPSAIDSPLVNQLWNRPPRDTDKTNITYKKTFF